MAPLTRKIFGAWCEIFQKKHFVVFQKEFGIVIEKLHKDFLASIPQSLKDRAHAQVLSCQEFVKDAMSRIIDDIEGALATEQMAASRLLAPQVKATLQGAYTAAKNIHGRGSYQASRVRVPVSSVIKDAAKRNMINRNCF